MVRWHHQPNGHEFEQTPGDSKAWYAAVHGTLKSLLQHHSSKASIFRHSAFFIVQLSHPYMTTGKTIALTRRTFVDKVMSLLFNMLSRLVMGFPGGSEVKAPACNAGDLGSILGEGNGNPLQYSCLENPRDGGAWWGAIYGVAQSQTQLKRLSSSSRQHIKKQRHYFVNKGPSSQGYGFSSGHVWM